MKYWTLFTCSLLFFNCSPKTVSDVNIPTAPVKTEDPTTSLDKVREGVVTISEKNKEIEKVVKDSTQNILKQKASIEEALAQAVRIKEKAIAQKVLTELEAMELETVLGQIQNNNLVLKTDNDNLSLKVENLQIIIEDVKKSEKETRDKLASSQDELKEFRTKFDQAVKDLQTTKKSEKALQEDLIKEKAKSSRNAVYRNWVIGLAIIIALYFLSKVALANYGIRI